MRKVQSAMILSLLMLCCSLMGCFGADDSGPAPVEDSSFNFERDIPATTWYHYAGGIDAQNTTAVAAANITVNLTGKQHAVLGSR